MDNQVFVVIPDMVFDDGERETLSPCGAFTSRELAREFVKDHFNSPEPLEAWDEEVQAESYEELLHDDKGYHAEIIIWGLQLT